MVPTVPLHGSPILPYSLCSIRVEGRLGGHERRRRRRLTALRRRTNRRVRVALEYKSIIVGYRTPNKQVLYLLDHEETLLSRFRVQTIRLPYVTFWNIVHYATVSQTLHVTTPNLPNEPSSSLRAFLRHHAPREQLGKILPRTHITVLLEYRIHRYRTLPFLPYLALKQEGQVLAGARARSPLPLLAATTAIGGRAGGGGQDERTDKDV